MGRICIYKMRNDDLGIDQFKGYINRSFNTSSFRIEDSYAGSRIQFGFGVHYKAAESIALVEVKYLLSKHQSGLFSEGETWKVVPKEAWEKFFNMFDSFSICSAMRKAMVDERQGRPLCFACEMHCSPSIGKLVDILPLDFLEVWKDMFPVFIKYHKVIKGRKDLDDMVSAMDDLHDASWKIKVDSYASRKKEIMEKLKRTESEIENNAKLLEDVYSEGAEAMNVLQEQFGIELDLTQKKEVS